MVWRTTDAPCSSRKAEALPLQMRSENDNWRGHAAYTNGGCGGYSQEAFGRAAIAGGDGDATAIDFIGGGVNRVLVQVAVGNDGSVSGGLRMRYRLQRLRADQLIRAESRHALVQAADGADLSVAH